jgi:cellulose synthase/poly-beta-1,6-N-acetylglucosamine synthase-like glycosyltransferase
MQVLAKSNSAGGSTKPVFGRSTRHIGRLHSSPAPRKRPMTKSDQIATATPRFSVIIGVYNDWVPLDRCLASLAEQKNAPRFEVIIVDDGSSEAAPEFICRWNRCYPMLVVRQAHAGVAAARNRGVQRSRGSLLVFADADCRFKIDSLAALDSSVADSPQHNCFQLHLIGDCSTLVGRVEELRLITLQNHLRQPNDCIRYLNTSGFAIRREKVKAKGFVFDPAALRAEDTLVLANLMQDGELPLFVANAIVQHAISLSLVEFFLKGIWSAYHEGKTYDVIASKGVRIRVTHRERLSMLSAMWRTSRERSIGRLAWFVLAARQSLRLLTSFAYRSLRTIVQLLSPQTFPGEHKHKSRPLKWDSPTESDAHRNL